MKIPHIITLLIIALLIFGLISQGYGAQQSQSLSGQNNPCMVEIKNTSGSTIWISNAMPLQKKELSIDDLETLGAIMVAPHSSDDIDLGRWFSIYTRVPQTNDSFALHYTIAQRTCKKTHIPILISLQHIESDQLSSSQFIVINHLNGTQIPEGSYTLCPGGKTALWDKKEEQWFCKLQRSHKKGSYHHEYVPVQTYMYHYLPDWLISMWYTKHPIYYNWYHTKSIFRKHLNNYHAPWQTEWYKQWYNQASENDKKHLHEPDNTIMNHTPNTPIAYGLPENKMDFEACLK